MNTKHYILIVCLLCTAKCIAQPGEQEVFFFKNTSCIVKQLYVVPEIYCLQTTGGERLININPYYGRLSNPDNAACTIVFIHDKRTGYIEKRKKKEVFSFVLAELKKMQVIVDSTVNLKAEDAFLKKYPLPKNYSPPEEFNFY